MLAFFKVNAPESKKNISFGEYRVPGTRPKATPSYCWHGWHRPLSPNVYFNISRKSFISSVPSQNCHFKRHINLFHLQTLMNACPVTVSALNSASTLQAAIIADAVLDSFWIQMAELAQVNLNPLSSGWRHLLKAANKTSFRSPFLLYL